MANDRLLPGTRISWGACKLVGHPVENQNIYIYFPWKNINSLGCIGYYNNVTEFDLSPPKKKALESAWFDSAHNRIQPN